MTRNMEDVVNQTWNTWQNYTNTSYSGVFGRGCVGYSWRGGAQSLFDGWSAEAFWTRRPFVRRIGLARCSFALFHFLFFSSFFPMNTRCTSSDVNHSDNAVPAMNDSTDSSPNRRFTNQILYTGIRIPFVVCTILIAVHLIRWDCSSGSSLHVSSKSQCWGRVCMEYIAPQKRGRSLTKITVEVLPHTCIRYCFIITLLLDLL